MLLLSFLQHAQLLVSIGFQRAGHQPIIRVDAHVAALSQIRLVASTFHLLLAQSLHLVQSSLQFLLHGERRFDGYRRYDFHEQLPYGLVHIFAGNPLAHRLRIIDGSSVTDIVRHAAPSANMVNHLHALAADAADHQTLQQSGTLTRWALPTFRTEGMGILLKSSLAEKNCKPDAAKTPESRCNASLRNCS